MATTAENVENTEKSKTSDTKASKDPIAIDGDDDVVITEDGGESSELDKYWKAVKENPADFTGWTYLLQFVEQENKLDYAKESFNSFLARYPYCYGYWKKYTDFLKKHDQLDSAEEVFERGVKAIPLSIDLWIHYINFTNNKYNGLPVHESKLRELYDRAIMAAGTDFRSDKLWDKYIAWETENKNERAVTALYDRLLKIPTQLYSQHFEKFSFDHIQKHHPKNLLSLDEFLRLRKEVAKLTVEGHQAEDAVDADTTLPPGEEEEVEAPPGLEEEDTGAPGVEPEEGDKEKKKSDSDAADDSTKSKSSKGKSAGDESEVLLLRKRIIALRQEIHKKTEEEVSKRWTFEERIRRPYFHVKALERAQLRNWREYIDFEIQEGSHERVVVLFERCLIACALYEEFWLKYGEYMEGHSLEGVRSVFQRACQIHLPKKPSLHLAWAAFEEKQGNYSAAITIFDQLEVNICGLAMVGLRRISLERRQGNHDKVNTLYKDKIEQATTPQTKTFYSIKYARYLVKNACNIAGAKEVLHAALKEDESNPKLILQLIDLEFNMPVVEESEMCKMFDLGIHSKLGVEHRLAFSQRKLEYLEDFGSDVKRLSEAYDSHQKLLKELQSKKRKALGQTDEKTTEAKKSKLDSEESVLLAATLSAAPSMLHPAAMDHTAMANGGVMAEHSMVSSTTPAVDHSAYYNATGQYNYDYSNYNYAAWGQQQQQTQQQYGYYQ